MIEEIRIVLERRAKIVDMLLSGPLTDADRSYYKGKLEGYNQAIDLLNSTRESIQVELR